MAQATTRQANGYAGYCMDCGVEVAAGEGGLYRYSGANMISSVNGHRRVMKKSRYSYSGFTFRVRCAACTEKHDFPKGRPVTDESAVSYQPVATIGNSQPIGWD